MIISVHIPKTGGTSFAKSLEQAYGETLMLDYGHHGAFDELLKRGKSIDTIHRDWLVISKFRSVRRYRTDLRSLRNIQVVHGHFAANKYIAFYLVNRAKYITWIREPFDRMVSTFYYWQGLTNDQRDPFVRKIFDERWTLERCCFYDVFRNYQCLYFKGFPIRFISFMGIVEYFAEDLDFLANEVFVKDLKIYAENRTQRSDEMDAALRNDRLRRQFKEYHRKDYELYEFAKSLRRARKLGNGH